MKRQIQIVKKKVADELAPAVGRKNQQQRNREIVGVVKSWIEDFRLRSRQVWVIPKTNA